MALRCLLFSSDGETSQPVCQILAELGIEAEDCQVAVEAIEQVSKQNFQLVIVDWENQPEATLLLNAARERKASERPLALAIVANDVSVSPALQAGANSVLRKPIQDGQARDTLMTAQGLLRSKLEPRPIVQAAAAGAGVGASKERISGEPAPEKALRAGEFLQSGATPGTQFVTESEVPTTFDQAVEAEVDPLKDLEPMAASVEDSEEAKTPAPAPPDEPRGLAWYLKARGVAAAPEPAPAQEASPARPDLLSFSDAPAQAEATSAKESAKTPETDAHEKQQHEQRTEAVLFAYISGEGQETSEPKPRRPLSKLTVIGGFAALLAVSYFVVPQSLWKPKAKVLVARGARAVHGWLNPQPAVTAPAPRSYESFARPGDEYKLPVAETIPDATTDPSQIRVLPVIDPTAKHPTGANATQDAPPVDTSPKDNPDTIPADQVLSQQGQTSGPVVTPAPQDNPPAQASPASNGVTQPPAQSTPPAEVHHDPPVNAPVVTPMQTSPQVAPVPRTTTPTGSIPSSLRSQMASMTPEASGNKPVDAALPSIEPVELPESAARSLILEQPGPIYPDSAKGQQGTVVLQLLIGRDGSVQDTKFVQGSLAFARVASDAVRQWRFKPYTLNTHPVSVKTVLTLHFKPTG